MLFFFFFFKLFLARNISSLNRRGGKKFRSSGKFLQCGKIHAGKTLQEYSPEHISRETVRENMLVTCS